MIPGRYDFQTWVSVLGGCHHGELSPECIHITGAAAPIAKASNYSEHAHLGGSQYALTAEDPFGLRSGNVCYGPPRPLMMCIPGIMSHGAERWSRATTPAVTAPRRTELPDRVGTVVISRRVDGITGIPGPHGWRRSSLSYLCGRNDDGGQFHRPRDEC